MGEIVTFYSYKGGTGRTMALANTAVLVAKDADGPVLMIDWDLEAPGLEHYFKPFAPNDLSTRKGLFDLVQSARKRLPKMAYGEEDEVALNRFFTEEIDRLLIPLSLPGNKTGLYFIKAGLVNEGYAKRINQFSWSGFYKKIPGFFPALAKYLAGRFDSVFIDSRTGHTDIGGICTMVMPDKLVMVFTPNDQSLNGVLDVARKSADYRIKYDNEMRPLLIYPLPSRLDFSGVSIEKRQRWQATYEMEWGKAFQEIYDLPATISMQAYFSESYLRHDSNYAFGEELAVLLDLETPESIAQDYQRFSTWLSTDQIWENRPFANMTSPFELLFVFAKADKEQVAHFLKHIASLSAQRVVIWDGPEPLPMEEWDEVYKRKAASGTADFTLVFLSANLMELTLSDGYRWEYTVEETLSVSEAENVYRVIPILLEPVELDSIFDRLPIFPGRSKPLSESSSPEESWLQVVALFRREAIKFNEYLQKQAQKK